MEAIFLPGWATHSNIFQPYYSLFSKKKIIKFNFFSSKKFFSEEENLFHNTHNNALIAFSTGGLYALKWASKYNFKLLILFSCFTSFAENNIQKKMLAKLKSDLLINPYLTLKKFHQNLNYPYQKKFNIKKNTINEDNLMLGLKFLETQNISIQELKKISCPTLIFHGLNDRIVPIHHFKNLHSSIDNSSSYLHKEAGHSLLIHQSDYILEKIKLHCIKNN